MRTLFIIPLVLMSLVSFPSWGYEIKGSYFCNYKFFEDGSLGQSLIEVSSSGLILQYIDMKAKPEFKLIHKHPRTGVSVFQFQYSVLILSPTNNYDRIEYNNHHFVGGEGNDMLSQGICKRSYIN